MKPFTGPMGIPHHSALHDSACSPTAQPVASPIDPGWSLFASITAASTSVKGFVNDIMAATATLGGASEKSAVTTVPNFEVDEAVSASGDEGAEQAEMADHPGAPGRPTPGSGLQSASRSGSDSESGSEQPMTPRSPLAQARSSGIPRFSELRTEVCEPDAIDALLASARARMKEAEQQEATQTRIGSIVRWWKNEKSPPLAMLRHLEIELGDVQSVAVLLKQLCDSGSRHPGFEPAMALVIAATNREDRSLQSLVDGRAQASRDNATKRELEADLKHVRKLLDACVPELNAQRLGLLQAFGAIRFACMCPPSRLRSALAVLQNATSGPPERALLAKELLAEIRYSHRDAHGAPQPMTWAEYLLAGARSGANGLREGGCHWAARVLAQGGALYLISNASLPVRIGFAVLGTGLPQLYAVWRLHDVESSEYKAHPSKAFTLMKVLSLASPLLLTVGPIAAGGAMANNALMNVGLKIGEGLSINAIGRVVRQLFQSWTMSSLTAPVSLVHADGIGLSASEQMSLNCMRDDLYTATSILLIGVGPIVTQEWLKQAIAALKTAYPARNAFVEAMLRNILGGLNEMCDGWNPDAAKALRKLLWGEDYVLQPGTQRNPGKDPGHFLNQSASRVVSNTPSDIFSAAAQLADEMAAPREVGIALRLTSALFNGLVGGLRGRVISVVSTTTPMDQDGSRNPSGRLSWATKAAQSLWSPSATVNPSWLRTIPAPPPAQGATEASNEYEGSGEERSDVSDGNDNDNGRKRVEVSDDNGNDADNR